MIFNETPLKGAFTMDLKPIEDERGFFARSFCVKELAQAGVVPAFATAQQNVSFNKAKGILRGLHFQKAPYGEMKIVRCTRGAIWDVIVDLRPQSPTFLKWHAEELTAENHRAFFIPEGFAHGFLTLEDNTELFYQLSEYFVPTHYAGVRWDDPQIAIRWPFPPATISDKDRALPTVAQISGEL